jgi:Uma2 family endonuclease
MLTMLHQLIVRYLHRLLDDFVKEHAEGEVFFAPLPVHLGSRHFRDPDIAYCRPHRIGKLDGQPEGADLVIEVVSEGKKNRHRDLKVKPKVYAAAGIAEYWIVDPKKANIQVLSLSGDAYRELGKFVVGEVARSALLEGFSAPVRDVLTAGGAAVRGT